MALETIFRRFSLLPGFIQTGNGEPRKAHWLGNKTSAPAEQQPGQHGQDERPPQRDPRGYRSLSSLTLGEVQEAYEHFRHQLVQSPTQAWIARNYFCQLPLQPRGQDRPPVVFGRVKTCYPGDGYVNNIEQMEIYFPQREKAPDLLHLRAADISLQKPALTYCVGVKVYVSEAEMADFSHSENVFLERGFAPLYETGYLDLLEMNEQNHRERPWLYLIGSGWFAAIPESMQPEIREQLRSLIRWRKALLNYHPRRYSLQVRSLNEELDFQYGFTEHYLVAPQDTGQALRKVEEQFGEVFMRGMKDG